MKPASILPTSIVAVLLQQKALATGGQAEDGAEHDPPTGLNEWLPVGGVTTHDLALVVGHVEGKVRTRRHETKHERAHAVNL